MRSRESLLFPLFLVSIPHILGYANPNPTSQLHTINVTTFITGIPERKQYYKSSRVDIKHNGNMVDAYLRDLSHTLSPRQMPGPLPQGWEFQQFRSIDTDAQALARSGIADGFRLAVAAFTALQTPKLSPSYFRYFQTKDLKAVTAAFAVVLAKGGFYQDCDEPSVLTDVSIWWEDPLHVSVPHCTLDAGCVAYFDWDPDIDPDYLHVWDIVLCPSIVDVAARRLDDIACEELGAAVTLDIMDFAGRTILHEMFHAPEVASVVGLPSSLVQIQDFPVFIDSDTEFQGLSDGDIVPAYGPFWSNWVNSSPDLEHGTENADNYAWFAVEEFFRDKCAREFADPIRNPNDDDQPHGWTVSD